MGFAILEVLGKGLRRQNMDETHSTLDLHGFLTFFTDIGNWINNRNHLPIPEPIPRIRHHRPRSHARQPRIRRIRREWAGMVRWGKGRGE